MSSCAPGSRRTRTIFHEGSPVRPGDFIEFFVEIDLLGALSALSGETAVRPIRAMLRRATRSRSKSLRPDRTYARTGLGRHQVNTTAPRHALPRFPHKMADAIPAELCGSWPPSHQYRMSATPPFPRILAARQQPTPMANAARRYFRCSPTMGHAPDRAKSTRMTHLRPG